MHSFAASSLFSQATTPAVPANAVYLSGHLPASSLLHLALNHLKSFRPPRIDYSLQANQESLHDDSEHIQYEQERQNERKAHVLILTPNRADLMQALKDGNDTSLTAPGSNSVLHKLLDRIEIKSVPSFESGCTLGVETSLFIIADTSKPRHTTYTVFRHSTPTIIHRLARHTPRGNQCNQTHQSTRPTSR